MWQEVLKTPGWAVFMGRSTETFSSTDTALSWRSYSLAKAEWPFIRLLSSFRGIFPYTFHVWLWCRRFCRKKNGWKVLRRCSAARLHTVYRTAHGNNEQPPQRQTKGPSQTVWEFKESSPIGSVLCSPLRRSVVFGKKRMGEGEKKNGLTFCPAVSALHPRKTWLVFIQKSLCILYYCPSVSWLSFFFFFSISHHSFKKQEQRLCVSVSWLFAMEINIFTARAISHLQKKRLKNISN